MVTTVALFDAYRTLNESAISGSFAAVGTPFTHMTRMVCITNNTDGDMIFSTDGVTSMLFVPKNSFKLFDITTNRQNNAPEWVIQSGTQWYVKQSTAPTTGDVYVESVYGKGE